MVGGKLVNPVDKISFSLIQFIGIYSLYHFEGKPQPAVQASSDPQAYKSPKSQFHEFPQHSPWVCFPAVNKHPDLCRVKPVYTTKVGGQRLFFATTQLPARKQNKIQPTKDQQQGKDAEKIPCPFLHALIRSPLAGFPCGGFPCLKQVRLIAGHVYHLFVNDPVISGQVLGQRAVRDLVLRKDDPGFNILAGNGIRHIIPGCLTICKRLGANNYAVKPEFYVI